MGKQDIPSEEVIAQLPRGAQVAFAARCARRVLPLFKYYLFKQYGPCFSYWVYVAQKHVEAVEKAIAISESPFPYFNAVASVSVARTAIYVFDSSADIAFAATRAAISAAAYAEVEAALDDFYIASERGFFGAASRAESIIDAATHDITVNTIAAANAATRAAEDVSKETRIKVIAAMNIDFKKLKEAAKKEEFRDDDYVPPEWFGPIWPEGAPKDWPVTEKPKKIQAVPIFTAKEIRQLPKKAQVAFAARCARRVLPLYKYFWPEAPDEHVNAVEVVIAFAESDSPPSENANAVDDNAIAAINAVPSSVAKTVAYAAYAAYQSFTINSVRAAAKVVVNISEDVRNKTIAAMRRDFEKLKEAATRENWDNKHHILPEWFGPIWPNGAPERWLADTL